MLVLVHYGTWLVAGVYSLPVLGLAGPFLFYHRGWGAVCSQIDYVPFFTFAPGFLIVGGEAVAYLAQSWSVSLSCLAVGFNHHLSPILTCHPSLPVTYQADHPLGDGWVGYCLDFSHAGGWVAHGCWALGLVSPYCSCLGMLPGLCLFACVAAVAVQWVAQLRELTVWEICLLGDGREGGLLAYHICWCLCHLLATGNQRDCPYSSYLCTSLGWWLLALF